MTRKMDLANDPRAKRAKAMRQQGYTIATIASYLHCRVEYARAWCEGVEPLQHEPKQITAQPVGDRSWFTGDGASYQRAADAGLYRRK